jgi:hypothetical protein
LELGDHRLADVSERLEDLEVRVGPSEVAEVDLATGQEEVE